MAAVDALVELATEVEAMVKVVLVWDIMVETISKHCKADTEIRGCEATLVQRERGNPMVAAALTDTKLVQERGAY